MVHVIKKRGRKQAFSSAKIRNAVLKSAKDAKLSPAKVKQLVKDVADPVISLAKGKRRVKAADLRRSLLGRLDRRAKSVSNAWRRFDKKKSR